MKKIFQNIAKLLTRGDKFLIVLLLILCVLTFWQTRHGNKMGVSAVVFVDKVQQARLSLEQEGVYPFSGPLGVTIVRVEKEQIFVEKSSCPYHMCERTGPIQRAGQIIVCLPNHLYIKIEAPVQTPYFEAITQ